MHKERQHIIGLILVPILLSTVFVGVNGENQDFILEAEQNWGTYGVGGTCTYGTHNVFVGDVDLDGAMEILTGGFAYGFQNGSRTVGLAPLRIWSWNGQNVSLEAGINWVGNILCLYASDLDKDNNVELITAGSYHNRMGNYTTSCLRIWHLSDQDLILKADYEGVAISSIYVLDVDKDGVEDILTVGRLRKGTVTTGQLCLWHFKDNALSLAAKVDLDAANVTNANSVFASDLDSDGRTEIVVGGYSDNLNNSKGQISIWQWGNQEFVLKADGNWQLVPDIYAKTIAGAVQGNTIVNNVKAADLDGDGLKEVVTGGFAYDGEKVNAQLTIWRWNGNELTELGSQEWTSDYLTEVKSVSLADVDKDGKIEVVSSGITAAQDSFKNTEGLHDRGQLKVWAFNGSALVLKQSAEWTFDDGACAWNVGTGDVDKDGVPEIITVGCTALGGLCDPDMRIWSLPNVNSTPSYLPYLLAITLLAIGISSLVIIVGKIRRKPTTGLSSGKQNTLHS